MSNMTVVSPSHKAMVSAAASGAGASDGSTALGALPGHLDKSFRAMVTHTGKPMSAPVSMAPIGNQAVQAHCMELLANKNLKNDQDVQNVKAAIQGEINNLSTPPDLKAGLQNLLMTLNGLKQGEHYPFNNEEMATISVLQRHRGEFPIKLDQLQAKIDDPNTPPDMKVALEQVRDDPSLTIALDATNQGGGTSNLDGCLSDRDLDRLGESPAMQHFNEVQAHDFTLNYTPSDDPSAKGVRVMTANDAFREFYLYSDNLPGDLDRKRLKDIVDGQAEGRKAPPQVLAAAQYFREHPAAWDRLTADNNGKPDAHGGTSRSHMLDNIAKLVYLNSGEKETLNTLDKNRGVFFSSTMTRDTLKTLVNSPDTKPDIKKAAQKLLDDPLLFGMLDNGQSGHSSNLIKTADDGKISPADLDACMAHLTTKDKKQPPLPPIHQVSTRAEKNASAAMQAGQVDHPDIKQEKGGGLIHFLRAVISPVLKIAAGIEHAVSIALSVLAKIPIIGEIAAPLSIAAEAMAGGMNVLNAAIKGEDIKKAAMMAGVGIAGALVGLVVVGSGAALAKGLSAGIEKIAVNATAKGAEKAAERGATGGATASVKNGATGSTGTVAKKEGFDQSKQEASANLKDEARNVVSDRTQRGNNGSSTVNSSLPSFDFTPMEINRVATQNDRDHAETVVEDQKIQAEVDRNRETPQPHAIG